ncbi:MAG: helix-turn-helix domain-containing protein [Propionibacteriaceae bacterium]
MDDDEFPGQRLCVLARPTVRTIMTISPLSQLLVTDVGYFPRAAHHQRERPGGCPELVVIICTQGKGRCTVDGVELLVGAGQAVVLPPGVPHSYLAADHDPWTIWWLHVVGADVAHHLTALGTDRLIDLSDRYRAVAAVERVLTALETDETLPNLVTASGSAWSLLAQLVADSRGRTARTEPIRAAQDYLRENLEAPSRVPDLARRAGLSTQHFSALFRAATGGGVLDWTRRLRMARARELLTTTQRSISDIGRAVGYLDPLYFSRQFRRLHQLSPTSYRRQHA